MFGLTANFEIPTCTLHSCTFQISARSVKWMLSYVADAPSGLTVLAQPKNPFSLANSNELLIIFFSILLKLYC